MNGNRLSSLFLVATLAAPVAPLANKEHDQILAELRQLQIQLSVLHTNQGRLEQALERMSNLLIEQDSSIRRTLVDTGTTLDSVHENLMVLSEKLDETNGRLGNLRREVASLRPTQLIVIPETPEGGSPPPSGGGPPPSDGDPPTCSIGRLGESLPTGIYRLHARALPSRGLGFQGAHRHRSRRRLGRQRPVLDR